MNSTVLVRESHSNAASIESCNDWIPEPRYPVHGVDHPAAVQHIETTQVMKQRKTTNNQQQTTRKQRDNDNKKQQTTRRNK